MSVDDFYKTYGQPENFETVPNNEVVSARGRLPDDLIDFWVKYGIGSYADGLFWLCIPSLIDPLLDRILLNVPNLRGKLSAFAYDAKGVVHLWHMSGRHYVLLLPFGAIDDQTSRKETAPVPYDLADLYRAAGIEFGPDAIGNYLADRNTPEEIWSVVFGLASRETYNEDLGDDLRPLPDALKFTHGRLHYGEFYCRIPERLENISTSFRKMNFVDCISILPERITVSHAVEDDGQQRIVEQYYSTTRPR